MLWVAAATAAWLVLATWAIKRGVGRVADMLIVLAQALDRIEERAEGIDRVEDGIRSVEDALSAEARERRRSLGLE